MRNSYPGICYRCNLSVAAGEGHFERFRGSWRVQHSRCAIEHRGSGDPVMNGRDAQQLHRKRENAKGTGKKAQKARKFLRDLAMANDRIRYEDF